MSAGVAAAALPVLYGLDRLRGYCIRTLGAPAKVLVRNRKLRVMVAGSAVVMTSLAATLFSPFWLLALGPVILGTPHLVADLRYLVIRPGLHLRRAFWLPVGIPLLLAAVGFYSLFSGLAACAAMAVVARGAIARKVLALGAVGCLGAGAFFAGPAATIVFAHLHNFIAVMLWWCWRPRKGAQSLVVPLLFVFASALILFGLVEPALSGQPGRLGPDYHLWFLAPGLGEPWALRVVILYAFAQSVHYGVWLRLIPEDDRPRDTPRTFSASARMLVADMGKPLLAGAVLLALGIALWAVFDLASARANYLRMALFHGYLELIAATWLFVERSPTAVSI